MRLKSKLAREWIKANTTEYGKGIVVNKNDYAVQDAAKQAYLAGFEKARAMAAEAMDPMLLSMITRDYASQLCQEIGEQNIS